MPTFSLSKFLPLLIAFCLLPCLFMGRAGAQTLPVSSGLIQWLKADAGVYKDAAGTIPATADGDPVAKVTDQSSGANNYSQTTTANQPVLRLTNGIYGIDMSANKGLNQSLSLSSGNSYSIFLVYVNKPSATDGGTLMTGNSLQAGTFNAGGKVTIVYGLGGSFLVNNVSGLNSANINYSPSPPVLSVLEMDFHGTALDGYYDGQSQGTETVTGFPNVYGLSSSSCVLREILIYNRVITAAERTSLTGYFQTRNALAGSVLFCGNSLVSGSNSTAGFDFPTQVMNAANYYPWANVAWANIGYPGRTSEFWNTIPTQATTALYPLYAPCVQVYWELTNSLAVNNDTPAQAVAAQATWCQAMRLAGFRVIVLSCIPRSGLSEATRNATNALVRSGWTAYADAFVDVGNDATVGQAGQNTNTTYYAADQVHMTNAGYAVIARQVAPAIAGLITATNLSRPSGTKRKTQ